MQVDARIHAQILRGLNTRVTPTTSCRLGSPGLVPKPDVRVSVASGFPVNTANDGSTSWLAAMTTAGATCGESHPRPWPACDGRRQVAFRDGNRGPGRHVLISV